MNFGDDITCQIRLAKKNHFMKQEEKRVSQEIELQVSKCLSLDWKLDSNEAKLFLYRCI